jgi:hypothetical protein
MPITKARKRGLDSAGGAAGTTKALADAGVVAEVLIAGVFEDAAADVSDRAGFISKKS